MDVMLLNLHARQEFIMFDDMHNTFKVTAGHD